MILQYKKMIVTKEKVFIIVTFFAHLRRFECLQRCYLDIHFHFQHIAEAATLSICSLVADFMRILYKDIPNEENIQLFELKKRLTEWEKQGQKNPSDSL